MIKMLTVTKKTGVEAERDLVIMMVVSVFFFFFS